jgi:ABC-type multidrug transport system fused ATPase/permease subunit
MMLASVLGPFLSVIGASVKIVQILDYIPSINTTGGIKLRDDCRGEV